MSDQVTLVIPGRNEEGSLPACLEAVVPILDRPDSRLARIIFVDDGSTDRTPEIAARFPVEVITGKGEGAGAARNLGWRAATTPLVWFVDADCVAEPDALEHLLAAFDDPTVAGCGGSYGIMNESSQLAILIHEEIVERHLSMGSRVDFLATFNVVYRREVLEAIDGFDERYLKAQDAELAYRIIEAGHSLGFDIRSRVRHFHEDRLFKYLRVQRQQGYWRIYLHLEHENTAGGDSYSRLIDHIQPPIAMLALASLPAALHPVGIWAPVALFTTLLLLQLPLTIRLVRRTGKISMLAFAPMSSIRAVWRGIGMTLGVLAYVFRRKRRA